MESLEQERDRYKKSLDESKRIESQLNHDINKLLANRQRESDFSILERKLEMKIKVYKLFKLSK
jgi:hypothetical protein